MANESIIKWILSIFSNPVQFFKEVKNQKNLTTSIVAYLIVAFICGIISVIMSALWSLKGMGSLEAVSYSLISLIMGLVMIPISLVMGVIILFIWAAILLGLSKAFKGKGDYIQTSNVVFYSAIPNRILLLIPLMGILIGIVYGLILQIIGIKEVQDLSTGKACAVVLIPGIFLLGIVGSIIVAIILFLGFSMFGGLI